MNEIHFRDNLKNYSHNDNICGLRMRVVGFYSEFVSRNRQTSVIKGRSMCKYCK